MCLICVEYFFKRMTNDEVKKALPEMVMFAKTEDERSHYKKLQSMDTIEEMEAEAEAYVSKNHDKDQSKNEYKVSSKTRRS